jgi:hypothetical protein
MQPRFFRTTEYTEGHGKEIVFRVLPCVPWLILVFQNMLGETPWDR